MFFGGTSQCDVRFRYAMVTDMLFPENVEAFEQRMKISTDWSRYAKMARAVLDAGARQETDLVGLLYSIDAYRQKEIWRDLVGDLLMTDYGSHLFMRKLIQAWHLTNKIGFADLTEEQQVNLKGPAIAEAIRQKRRDIYSQQA
jgi:hypothetical protein